MLRSIILAKLLIMFCINHSLIIAGDQGTDEFANDRGNAKNKMVMVPGLFLMVSNSRVGDLPRTKSGNLQTDDIVNFWGDLEVVCPGAMQLCLMLSHSTKNAKEQHLGLIQSKKEDVENIAREALNKGFKWGSITVCDITNREALNLVRSDQLVYFPLALELVAIAGENANLTRYLGERVMQDVFIADLGRSIAVIRKIFAEINELNSSPMAKLISEMPRSPVASNHLGGQIGFFI